MLQITLLSSLLGLVFVHAQLDSANFKPIFNKDETVPLRKSKEMLKYMNLKADPCNDFYEFACGNWNKYHSNDTRKNLTNATPLSNLDLKIDSDLRSMLQEQVTLEDGINGRKLKEFYKSCLAAERNGLAQQQFFSEFIKSYRGFPAVPGSNWQTYSHNYNWQQVIGQLRFHYGLNILVGLKVDVNHKYTPEDSIFVGEPSTFIPRELCNAEASQALDPHGEAYALIEKEVAENLHAWLSLNMQEAKKLAAEMVSFELELCSAMQLDAERNQSVLSTIYPNYPRKTLSEITRLFNNNIDFVISSYGTPIAKPVFLTAEPYFHQLIKTVREHNKTTIANYIMYRALASFSFAHDDHPNTRSEHCLHMAKRYLPKVVGDMYYRKFASVVAKADTDAMFDKLKYAFEQSLRQPWIEESTSRVGKSKLTDMSLSFAAYDKLTPSNLQINSTNYWHNLAALMAHYQQQQFKRIFDIGRPQYFDEVEAYETRLKYRAQNKHIEIGWGLLQEPLYHQLYPNAMRFAALGQRLAQELAAAFSDLVWTADYLGLMNWDRQTELAYRNRSECFRRQVGNYLHNDPNSFQNITKLRELIATSAGLNVAFKAYLNWLLFLNPNNDFAILSKETLPELNFTNTQLFFIAYAQMHCTAEPSSKPAPAFTPLAEHTLARYTVNGPLWNFLEFARDFGCPAGVPMNPADKCVIY